MGGTTSWLSLGYALWLMLFRAPATILLFSLREEESKELPWRLWAWPPKYKTLQQRLHGYMAALTDAGIRVDEYYVQPSISQGQPRKGYREMQRLLALETDRRRYSP